MIATHNHCFLESPGEHTLKAKVDTGAQGNILLLRTFQRMFPAVLDTDKTPRPRATPDSNTRLTAYTDLDIKHFGKTSLACKFNESYWVTTDFYVIQSHGQAIIGLPSCRDLHLVIIHCAINTQPQRINTIGDFTAGFPDRFDKIGDFRDPYHIVKDPHVPQLYMGTGAIQSSWTMKWKVSWIVWKGLESSARWLSPLPGSTAYLTAGRKMDAWESASTLKISTKQSSDAISEPPLLKRSTTNSWTASSCPI